MPAVADVMTVPSDSGCENCGTCQSSIFSSLPTIFEGAGKAVAQITAANNQTEVAKLNATTQLSMAQIAATSQQKIMMEILLALGLVGLVYLGTRKSK